MSSSISSTDSSRKSRPVSRRCSIQSSLWEKTENAGTGKPSDVEILLSMPGIGFVTAATLVSEAYDLIRRRDYKALRCVAGTAPVTKQSGKSKYVMRRRTSSRRLQTALYHWAGVAVLHDPVSKARYASLRARGLRHSRSLRTVGDRLLYVACTLNSKKEKCSAKTSRNCKRKPPDSDCQQTSQ